MSKILIHDLIEQYKHTFRIIYEEIERFNDQDWVDGFSFFQVPVKQSMHLLDCLDFYFRKDEIDAYVWGYRFGGGWWELRQDQLPEKKQVLDYVRELETFILGKLESMDDQSLSDPSPIQFKWARTRHGLYIYALRHTLHHHGELAALAVYHGYEGGSWE
jgi:hypothetical protein